MSDFNKIIEYLRYTRRDEEREAKTTHRPAIIITEDFDLNAPFHEEDYIYVDKKKIEERDGYDTLRTLFGGYYYSKLYLRTQSSDDIEYYIRKPIEIDGEELYQYRKLPSGNWHINNPLSFTEVKVGYTFYYSSELEKCIYLPLNEVVLFPEQITYHPNDLKNSASGGYSFKFKDAEGYTGEGIDLVNLDPESIFKARRAISESNRRVDFQKTLKPGLVHLLPKIKDPNWLTKSSGLQYNYFEKGAALDSIVSESAINLKFNHFGAQLLFLNATIFYYFNELDDFEVTRERQAFFDNYTSFVDDLLDTTNTNNILEVLYYVPTFYFRKLDEDFLWKVLDKVLEGSVNNSGLDKEDIVLHLLIGLLEASTNADSFLLKLVEERENKETRFSKLYKEMDGENFVSLIHFLYETWTKSTFTDLDNPLFKTSDGPLAITYKSEKFIGFYSSNKNFDFVSSNYIYVTEDDTWVDNAIGLFSPETGEVVNKLVEEQNNYTYHYFHPLMLTDIEQESAIPIPKYIPAFFLKANEDKSFWSNVITGIEYGVDIITTLSGIGNIAKFRHLSKVAKVASRFNKFNKARKYASVVSKLRLASGAIEISSGTVNALIKLADLKQSPFWKELNTFLFWLEMLSLGGELTAAIKGGLRKSAKKALDYEDDILKELDEIIIEDGNVSRKLTDEEKFRTVLTLEDVADGGRALIKNIEELFDISGGRLLTKKELRTLKSFLREKYNVRLRFVDVDHTLRTSKTIIRSDGKKISKLEDWNRRGVVGSFKAGPPPEFFLRYNYASELTVFHEMVHLKYWFDKKLKVHRIQEEIVVFEEVWKTKKRWTYQELLDSYNYVVEALKEAKLSKDLEKFTNTYKAEISQIKLKIQYGIL